MAECSKCGVDSEELLAKLQRHVDRLDSIIWEYELAEGAH